MEGSFWRLGHDLADIYTGRMTLRQFDLRVNIISSDPQSPLTAAMREAHAAVEKRERAAALDDVHTRYRK